jgi:hypothetical protein
LREYLNGEFISLLPSDLQNVIKPVAKLSNYDNNNTIRRTKDRCFALSAEEVGAVIPVEVFGVTLGQGNQYPVFTDDASRKKRNIDRTAVYWWLRSFGRPEKFFYIDVYGKIDWNGYLGFSGVAFGFCI